MEMIYYMIGCASGMLFSAAIALAIVCDATRNGGLFFFRYGRFGGSVYRSSRNLVRIERLY